MNANALANTTRSRLFSRRSVVRGSAALGLALPVAGGLSLAKAPTVSAAGGAASTHPWYELGMMSDPILDQTLLFYLGSVRQGLADIGECLDTASRVDPADEWSWSREWQKTADRLLQRAASSEARGRRASAGTAYLRAATYYRAALHRYPEPATAEVRQLAGQAVDAFGKAIANRAIAAEVIRIPYEGTTLPGYLFRCGNDSRPRPLLIVHQGRDAWAEDCKYLAEAAVQRGYHALLFDGPGQGKVLRLQGLPFRPDWERVVGPVVDVAVRTPGVDPKRIALMGLSMGGALAPRAAAFEKRLKIVIADPGVYRWWQVVYDFIGSIDPGLLSLLDADPAAFDAAIAQIMAVSPFVRWGIKDTMWKHGAISPSDVMLKMKAYTNEGIAEQITCRTLVMDGTDDSFAQGKTLYDALVCPKDYMLFTAEDTGLAHCQVGALAVATERLFDWLDEYI